MRSLPLPLTLAASALFGFVLANCGGDSGGGGSSGSNLFCPSSNQTNCKQDEVDAYGKCVQDKCDGQIKLCFGDNYKTGTFAGTCGAYVTCSNKCSCTDNNCRAACAAMADAPCTDCLLKIGACTQSMGCKLSCPGGSDAGAPAGGSCADLQACCNQIADANVKMACQQQVTAGASAGAQYCSNVLMGFRASNMCH